MPTKPALQSKTIHGAIVSVVAMLALIGQSFGWFEFTDADQKQVVAGVIGALTIASTAYTVYGRWVADRPLRAR